MIKSLFFWITTCLLLVSCTAAQMATYDQYAYQKSIEVKVRASSLVDNAAEPYENHKSEAESLLLEVDKMILYEQNRVNNGISLQMWQFLADQNKFLLAGFIKKWKEEGQLSTVFATQAKIQMNEAMDILVRFEGSKDANTKSNMERFILSNQ